MEVRIARAAARNLKRLSESIAQPTPEHLGHCVPDPHFADPGIAVTRPGKPHFRETKPQSSDHSYRKTSQYFQESGPNRPFFKQLLKLAALHGGEAA